MEGDIDLKLYMNIDYIEDLIGVGKMFYIDGIIEQEYCFVFGVGLQIDVCFLFVVDDFVMVVYNGLLVIIVSNWECIWYVEVIGNSLNVDMIFDFEVVGVDVLGLVDNFKLFYYDGEEWIDIGLVFVVGVGIVKFVVDGL